MRLLYIVAIVVFASWLLRLLFPFFIKLFFRGVSKRMEKEQERFSRQNEQTVDYKVKEKENNSDDDEFIEYEEIK